MRSLVLALTLVACSPAPAPVSPSPAPPKAEEGPKGSVSGGSLPPVEVKKALQGKRDEIRACYHALLEKNKKASGKVVLRFTVGEDGVVEETVILNETTLPSDTAQCIADVVKSVSFPKPEGGKARITYPWEFTAE